MNDETIENDIPDVKPVTAVAVQPESLQPGLPRWFRLSWTGK